MISKVLSATIHIIAEIGTGTRVKNCQFYNCKSHVATIQITQGSSYVESTKIYDSTSSASAGLNIYGITCYIDDVQFINTIANDENGALRINQVMQNSGDISIIGCTFDNFQGPNRRCINIDCTSSSLTLRNNTLKNMKPTSNGNHLITCFLITLGMANMAVELVFGVSVLL